MIVRVEIWLTSVRVFINDTLHLMFRRSAFVGLQSWSDDSAHCIEITMAGSEPIVAQYEKRETWLAVLAELTKIDVTAV